MIARKQLRKEVLLWLRYSKQKKLIKQWKTEQCR
jgi:hypothetical protein